MKKRILSMFIVIVMVITMFPVYSIPTSALTSGDFEYSVISKEDKTAQITDYNGNATELEIPSIIDGYTITTIGNWAFSDCRSLTSIIIPEGVTTVGDSAFSDCHSLTSIIIPEGVTSIGDSAFSGCSSLTSIIIPEGVTSIGDSAFRYCHSLTSIIIPEGVTSIGNRAFSSCYSLTSIIIPEGVTTIGDSAFSDCRSLTSIIVDAKNQCYSSDEQGVLFNKDKTTLIQYPIGNEKISYVVPDGVTLIAEHAFYYCDYLKYIALPSTITSIGDWAFFSCSVLTHVFFAGSETDWGKILIGTGNTKLTDATLHYEVDNSAVLYEKNPEETCTTAGTGTYKCAVCDATLHVVNFPSLGHNFENNNCTRCELPLFAYELDSNDDAVITGYNGTDTCVFVPSTVDGYTVKTIKITSSTVEIKSVTIPKTVTLIEGLPYSSLTEIIVDKDNKVYCSIDGVLFNKDATTLIKYPVERTDESYVIPEGVTTIGMGAFANGRNLRWVEFPSTLKTIEEQAFIDSYIQRAVLPEGLETIGYAAFYDCEILQKLYLPETLISIGDYAFGMSDYLTNVDLPESLESIGKCAFVYSQRLQTVTLGNKLKTIGDNAFSYCYALTSVEIPASVTTIGEENFYYCTSLTNIKVDNNNEVYCSIDGVLFDKDGTTLLVYPAGKTTNEYIIPDGVKTIGSSAFRYNLNLMSVVIPEGVASIGDWAFESCLNLKLLSIKSTMTTIGKDAFNNCSALSHVLFTGDEIDWNLLAIDSGNDYLTGTTRHCETDMSAIARKCVAEPTCTQEGTASCVCTICETELLTLPISALGHDMVNNVCTRCSAAEFSYSLDENNNAIITGYLGSATDAVIPSEIDGYTVTEIGVEAFANNEVIRNVTLPNTITKIGDAAFWKTFLTSIYIPSSVKEIGFGAFAMCLIEDITVDEQNTEYSSKDGVLFDKEQKTLIAYPIGKTRTRYTVPSSVTTIGDYAFMYSPNIINVQIPDSVTKIGMAAFTYSQNLSNITWPKNLTEIGQMAFMYTGITNVTIPDGVTTIEASTFYYCTSLSTVTLGSGIETVGISAFEDCGTLTTVNYNGTKCQWNQIAFNEGNSCLLNSTIHYKGDHAFSDFNFDTNAGVGESCAIKRTCSLCDEVETINFILGDANEDGVVDSQDYNIIVEASVLTTTLTYAQTLAADINGDGAVDTFDAICIDLALNGLLDNADVINMRTIAIVPKQDDENE